MKTLDRLAVHIRSAMAALNERDANTCRHSERTCALSNHMGESCGLTDRELIVLNLSALTHDVGKIGISDAVLLKPGRLDPDELALMRTHPVRSYNIIASISCDAAQEVARIIRHHHEAFDGSGYPDGLSGEAIPPLARIIALADSYDALATVRPYHEPRTHTEIMEILFGENDTHYDPYLRTKFVAAIEHTDFKAH